MTVAIAEIIRENQQQESQARPARLAGEYVKMELGNCPRAGGVNRGLV